MKNFCGLIKWLRAESSGLSSKEFGIRWSIITRINLLNVVEKLIKRINVLTMWKIYLSNVRTISLLLNRFVFCLWSVSTSITFFIFCSFLFSFFLFQSQLSIEFQDCFSPLSTFHIESIRKIEGFLFCFEMQTKDAADNERCHSFHFELF